MNQTDPIAVLARIRQMADCWEQHLPEVIRTPAVVSALRAAMEAAAPAAAGVAPAADQTELRDRIAKAISRYDYEVGLSSDDVPRDHHQGQAAAVLAVLPEPVDPADVLTDTDRKFLTLALDLAAGRMASRGDEFDADDEAAMEKLRRMAGEEQLAATEDQCPHGCDVSTCPCLACEADDEQSAASKEKLDIPIVVVICGSTRFMQEMAAADQELTWAGHIVVKPGCDMKTPHPLWADPAEAEAGKQRLDDLHRAKIRLADQVLIVGDYIGDSTRAEIAYARSLGKPIRFTHPDVDPAAKEACGAREPEPRTGTSPCVLPAGHGGSRHQDKWTNQWPINSTAKPSTEA